MPIRNVVINASNIGRSVDFYTTLLGATLVGEATDDRAVLDFTTATIELHKVDSGATSTWLPDDLQVGQRHIGFKVDDVDEWAAKVREAGVAFHLEPLNAEGGVRICFFYDPDHTLLEFVAGDLQYAEIVDQQGVDAERAMGVPARPRFDHVAVTAFDRQATEDFYRPLGFSSIGTIEQPHDPRGFHIGYLKSGGTVVEVFTYDCELTDREVQLDAPGFSHAELDVAPAVPATIHLPESGQPAWTDPNGLPITVAR